MAAYSTFDPEASMVPLPPEYFPGAKLNEAMKGHTPANNFMERFRLLHEITDELSREQDLDTLCRRAIETGLEFLGFDRLGILLYDHDTNELVGTFGTDEKGTIRDERGCRNPFNKNDWLLRILDRKIPFAVNRNSALFNNQAKIVGRGMWAVAGLWNGREVIGFLSLDNLIHGKPITDEDCEILSIFASSLGHLYSRLRQSETLHRKEEQLRQAQKMEAIGRLAGGVAHDFNNLLTSILGFSGIVQEALGAKHDLQPEVEEIINSARRAAKLTGQLLTFSRQASSQRQPVEVNMAVAEMNRLLGSMLGDNIELVTLLGDSTGFTEIDPTHLDQVLMNLAVNARDAMPHGGKLIISTSRMFISSRHPNVDPGHYIRLTVRDNGRGIAEEIQEKIFDPFFTTKDRDKGTGLGLSIVYSIINQNGGFIELQSNAEQGSEFQVYLPRLELPEEKKARPAKSQRKLPGGTESILVVEDEDAVRRLTVSSLKLLGYTVMEARHGEEAIRLFKQQGDLIDLVVSDVVMPRLGGMEMVKELYELRPDLKIIFTSGFVDSEGREQNNLEDIPLIPKPYTREKLANTVRTVLDKQSASSN